MDGMTDENLSAQFTGANHQLTVLPDETVAFYAYGSERLRRHQGARPERHGQDDRQLPDRA